MMDEEKFEPQRGDKVKAKFVPRTPMEVQRIKLEKLMSDPTKPVLIPTAKQKKDFSNAIPSFIRNVMGSSAGAGSGEFHVYRHLRRKEYARQKHIQQKSKKETLDDEYQQKLDNNRLKAEEKTAKKRAKRLKRKQNAKNKAKMPKIDQNNSAKSESETDDDETAEGEDTNNADQVITENESTIETNRPTDKNVVDGDGGDTETEPSDQKDSCDAPETREEEKVSVKSNEDSGNDP